MTTPPPDIAAITGKLTKAQQMWIVDAVGVEMDNPMTFVVLDDEEDPLPAMLCDDITGVLSRTGLAVRAHLLSKEQNDG